MDPIDIFWVILFTMTLFGIILVHYFMMECLKDKPLGSKTLHDAALNDLLWFTSTGGAIFCLIDIFSRFETVRHGCLEYPALLYFPCVMYFYAFVSICMHNGCTCIIKFLCIVNLTFMEESVGETLARILVIGNIVIFDASACALFWFQDDLRTGTAMTLLTNTSVPTGNSRLIPLNKTLCVDIVDQQEMNNLYRTTH